MLGIFNTSPELEASKIDTAVLPVGSVEPKGPHLPVGFDLMLANRFAYDFCTGKAVYLMPVLPYSTAMECRGFPGTVALQQQTLWDALFDIARVAARHRFKRLVILDFSNYNWILKHACREINLNEELLDCVWASPKQFAFEAAANLGPDYGGGAVETSLQMHLDPSLVKKPLRDNLPDAPREYVDYEGLSGVAPAGFWGRPTKATPELGERLYRLMLEETREFVNYAFSLFEDERPIEESDDREVWWPDGEIPGIETGLDWRSTISEIERGAGDLAVFPTSSTEQHSTSQPLATDYLQALEVARRVAERMDAYLLPALPVVTSWGHIKFRGTVTFSAMTARRVIEDVAASLAACGFRRVAIVNVHGGNWVVKPTIIEINRRYRDLRLVASGDVSYGDFRAITSGDILSYRGQADVEHLHASEGEAAFIKAFYPESFREDHVVDYSPNCPASAFDFVGIGGVTPEGVWGYPSQASAETGRKNLEQQVDETVERLEKTLEDLEKRERGREK